MKDKIKKTWSALLLMVCGLLICWLLYILLDWGLNGVMLDWLDKKFVSHQWVLETALYSLLQQQQMPITTGHLSGP